MNEAVIKSTCQSCGMPLAATEHFGTNSNGSPSPDYCCFCYQNGGFTQNFSMEEMIEHNLQYLDEFNQDSEKLFSAEEARAEMKAVFPQLKRWHTHQTTHQEYFKAINRAVDYINEHLNSSINLSDLADVAHISSFHFHRIFKSFLGESPGEYIQRLRLEKAIFRLQTTRLTLTEIAEQTGYQSPHALSKAFKKRFGMSPSTYRAQPSDLSVSIESTSFITIEPEIREIAGQQVITVRVANPYERADAFVHAWQKLLRFTDSSGLPGKDDGHEYLLLSRDISTITHPDLCRIYACITAKPGIRPKGEFGSQTIEGGLYAVFTYKGAYRNLEHLYCYIYRTWVPNSPYELRDITHFERYLNSPDTVQPDELLTEVYIPVARI